MALGDNCKEYADKKILHICEVCGARALLTPTEGFEKGWDYAPYMYPFKQISPRTCPTCEIAKTVWYDLVINRVALGMLTDKQKQVIQRIQKEPDSILVEKG